MQNALRDRLSDQQKPLLRAAVFDLLKALTVELYLALALDHANTELEDVQASGKSNS